MNGRNSMTRRIECCFGYRESQSNDERPLASDRLLFRIKTIEANGNLPCQKLQNIKMSLCIFAKSILKRNCPIKTNYWQTIPFDVFIYFPITVIKTIPSCIVATSIDMDCNNIFKCFAMTIIGAAPLSPQSDEQKEINSNIVLRLDAHSSDRKVVRMLGSVSLQMNANGFCYLCDDDFVLCNSKDHNNYFHE